jgi:DUF1365 family protein
MSGAATSALFPPPAAAASLYLGDVMHARMKPVAHRFVYRVFSMLLDADRLDEAARLSPLFSIGRFNLASFDPADHGPRDGSSLGDYARGVLAQAGVATDGARVMLLAYPRILGYSFNPLTVYFVYGKDESLLGVLYEVRNTFGEWHTYVAPVKPGELSPAGLRQERDKIFYVSPFNDLSMRYLFRMKPPGDHITMRILETDQAGPLLAASFAGVRADLTSATLVKTCLSLPLMTMKVMAGIHWEALRLYIKGLRLVARPKPPELLSFSDNVEGEKAHQGGST